MESWVGTDNLVLCSKWIKCTYSFPKSTKDVISVSISKHSNHCGSRSGLPYYNLTTSSIPHQEDSPYMPPGDILRNSVGLSPDNLHRYSVNEEIFFIVQHFINILMIMCRTLCHYAVCAWDLISIYSQIFTKR